MVEVEGVGGEPGPISGTEVIVNHAVDATRDVVKVFSLACLTGPCTHPVLPYPTQTHGRETHVYM